MEFIDCSAGGTLELPAGPAGASVFYKRRHTCWRILSEGTTIFWAQIAQAYEQVRMINQLTCLGRHAFDDRVDDINMSTPYCPGSRAGWTTLRHFTLNRCV